MSTLNFFLDFLLAATTVGLWYGCVWLVVFVAVFAYRFNGGGEPAAEPIARAATTAHDFPAALALVILVLSGFGVSGWVTILLAAFTVGVAENPAGTFGGLTGLLVSFCASRILRTHLEGLAERGATTKGSRKSPKRAKAP